MGVTTRQQCIKLGAPCCRDKTTSAALAPPQCAPYNLRPRSHPGPNYYETRVRRRNWTTPKRKPKAKPKPPAARRPRTLNERGDMEAPPPAKRCHREHPEPMDVDTESDVDAAYDMSDAQCEDLANDRLVEAVESFCTAFGIVSSSSNGDGCGSSAALNDVDVYTRMYPEYAHELSGYPDYNIMDLTQGPDIYYRIPVIEGGVVTPSWEEARCVVKQEVDDEGYVVPQDSPDISSGSGNETPAGEMPVDSEDITKQQVSLNCSVEDSTNHGSEEEEDDDWRNEAEGFCDSDSSPCDVQVPAVNSVGETSESEEHPQDDSDTDKSSDRDGCGMFFGNGARNNWPSPTVFPHEKKND